MKRIIVCVMIFVLWLFPQASLQSLVDAQIRSKIYVMEKHHELLYLWRDLGLKNIKVAHLDAHGDMHDMLVDREQKIAYMLDGLKRIDVGNFISFAVKEGIVREIRWIHDQYGGRVQDITHVKYTSDVTAIPFLIKNYFTPRKKYPLAYSVISFDEFTTIKENEHFNIDWDFFALDRKPSIQRQKSIKAFLARDFGRTPQFIYLCYSPYYVAETRVEFNAFIHQLQDKFNADAVHFSYPVPTEEYRPANLTAKIWGAIKWRFKNYIVWPLKKLLKKMGIY